jgi:hypothetical protein
MHVWPIVATPFQLFGSPTPPMPLPINGTDMTSMSLAMSTLSLSDPTMPQPELPATLTKAAVLLYMAGVFLLSAGFLIKFAATWSGGLDIYYYKVRHRSTPYDRLFHVCSPSLSFLSSTTIGYVSWP